MPGASGPGRVLRGWVALSVAIALTLLAAVWFVAGLLTPDLTPIHLPGLTEPSRARRPAADPLAQLAGPRAARDRLRRRLHRRRLDADRRRPAHRDLALDPRQGGRAGDPLRLRGDPLLALHPGALPRLPGLDDRLPARTSPASTLILSVLPHAMPGADRALPAARRLADRQPPRRVEPAARRDLRHRRCSRSRPWSSRRRSRSTSGPTSSTPSRRSTNTLR